MTLDQAIRAYGDWVRSSGAFSPLTHHSKMLRLKSFARDSQAGDICVSEETFSLHASKWVNRPGPTRASTRRQDLNEVRCLAKFCRDNGWLTAARFPENLLKVNLRLLPHASRESRYLRVPTDSEVGKLLRAARADRHPNWYPIIIIAAETGLRMGDVFQLEWACVHQDKLVVWTDKRDRRVSLPMTDALRNAFACIRKTDKDYLFPIERAQILDVKHRHNLSTQFKQICRKAGVLNISFHSLRHYFIHACRVAGIQAPHISQLVGHSSTEMTDNYGHNHEPPVTSGPLFEPKETPNHQSELSVLLDGE